MVSIVLESYFTSTCASFTSHVSLTPSISHNYATDHFPISLPRSIMPCTSMLLSFPFYLHLDLYSYPPIYILRIYCVWLSCVTPSFHFPVPLSSLTLFIYAIMFPFHFISISINWCSDLLNACRSWILHKTTPFVTVTHINGLMRFYSEQYNFPRCMITQSDKFRVHCCHLCYISTFCFTLLTLNS